MENSMDFAAGPKKLSAEETQLIDAQIRADLMDRVYNGCTPNAAAGVFTSLLFFIDFYGFSRVSLFTAWLIVFNVAMIFLAALFPLYLRYKQHFSSLTWQKVYTVTTLVCSLVWLPVIFFIPLDITRQYFGLLALTLAATIFATASIGLFFLSVTSVTIILSPLIIWCIYQNTFFYQIFAFYAIIYAVFLLVINYRSSRWLHGSLRLKLENTLKSYQINHDRLTDLPNQFLLPQYLKSAVSAVRGSDKHFLLVSFSLNRLETISDTLGHEANDLIIKSLANRLNALAMRSARMQEKNATHYIVTISRKDIFYIIVVPSSLEEAEEKVKHIFSVLEEPFYLETRELKLTASAGVSIFPKNGVNDEMLLINADVAMLRAKEVGGNRIEFYRSEINVPTPKQLEIESDLHDAIKYDQLQLHYQPCVDLKSGKIISVEALIRWLHPLYGMISPLKFIPIAEETGLIIPIGEWVLQQACTQLGRWHRMGYRDLQVGVNISVRQLRHESIIPVIERVLIETNTDPRYLELELTETGILDETVTPTIKKFKEIGLSLAVDDFGTGYSGLSYLRRFRIDKLKIDQSFIRDIPNDNDSMTIVAAIIAMAKELNITSLAEGVETLEQLEFLKSKHCQLVQGFYFSKPLEANFFTHLFSANHVFTADAVTS